MKIEVHYVASDTDNGTESELFGTEAEAIAHLWETAEASDPEDRTVAELKEAFDDDVYAALHACTGMLDTFSHGSEEIEIPDPKATVYILAYENLDGLNAAAFDTDAEREKAAEIIERDWSEEFYKPIYLEHAVTFGGLGDDPEPVETSPPPVDALQTAAGAIGELLEQINQMRGIFYDEDGTIQNAVDDGNHALGVINEARGVSL